MLITDEDGYVFRHALLREVVHEDLLPGQHTRLHARFAAVLEDTAELVAGHRRGGDRPPLVRRARRGQGVPLVDDRGRGRLAAHFEALKMYERALELWDQVADPESLAGSHVSLLDRAAASARDAGEIERALALTNRR